MPRVTEVIQAVGHGSNTTITKYYKQVQEKRASDKTPPDVIAAANSVHDFLEEKFQKRFEKQQEALEQELAALRARTEAAEDARVEADKRTEAAEVRASVAENERHQAEQAAGASERARRDAVHAQQKAEHDLVALQHAEQLHKLSTQRAQEKAAYMAEIADVATARAEKTDKELQQRKAEVDRLHTALEALTQSLQSTQAELADRVGAIVRAEAKAVQKHSKKAADSAGRAITSELTKLGNVVHAPLNDLAANVAATRKAVDESRAHIKQMPSVIHDNVSNILAGRMEDLADVIPAVQRIETAVGKLRPPRNSAKEKR